MVAFAADPKGYCLANPIGCIFAAEAVVCGMVGAGRRVFVGVELDPRLPPPSAGYDYFPSLLSGARTESQYYSHAVGYQAEINLANEVTSQGYSVVKWGDKIGAHGSDIVSVNPRTGEVVLWDSKYRGADISVAQSKTFSEADTRAAAVNEARDIIRDSSLPPGVKNQALQNLTDGNFITNTAGSGGARNFVQVRYCGNIPC